MSYNAVLKVGEVIDFTYTPQILCDQSPLKSLN